MYANPRRIRRNRAEELREQAAVAGSAAMRAKDATDAFVNGRRAARLALNALKLSPRVE